MGRGGRTASGDDGSLGAGFAIPLMLALILIVRWGLGAAVAAIDAEGEVEP